MIKVESLIYKIDLKLNKLAALEHQNISLEDKILALNEAQLKLVKSKLNPNNPLGQGLDSQKKRYEDLEVLMEVMHDHPLPLKEKDKRLNKWVADLKALTPQYMFYIDSYLLADKGGCNNRVIYVNKDLVKHADVTVLLANSNYKPSFEYEETFCTISDFNLEVYTDGTFTPREVFVAYMRYPQKMDYPGYIHFDDTPSVKSDCELPEYLEDELLNFTIEELAMGTENVPAVQFTQKRMQSSE